jgi:hypothetical protein
MLVPEDGIQPPGAGSLSIAGPINCIGLRKFVEVMAHVFSRPVKLNLIMAV